MKEQDLNPIEVLSKQFQEDAQKIELPDSLSRENIMALIESCATDENTKDNNVVSLALKEKGSKSVTLFKWLAGIAAALIVVNIAVLYFLSPLHSRNISNERIQGAVSSVEDEIYRALYIEEPTTKSKKENFFSALKRNNETTKTTVKAEPTSKVIEQETTRPARETKSVILEFTKTQGNLIYSVVTVSREGKESYKQVNVYSLSGGSFIQSIKLPHNCVDIFVYGNILTAVLDGQAGETDNCTELVFYDLSVSKTPQSAYTQFGSLVSAQLSGSKLCLLTSRTTRYTSYKINNQLYDISEDNIALGDYGGVYSFVSVIDLENINSNFVQCLVPGHFVSLCFNKTGVYLSSKYQVTKFSLDGEKLTGTATLSVSDMLFGDITVSDEGMARFFTYKDENNVPCLYANSYNFLTGEKFECKVPLEGKLKEPVFSLKKPILFCKGYALAYDDRQFFIIDFSDPEGISIVETEKNFAPTNAYSNGEVIFAYSKTEDDGIIHYLTISRNGIRFFDLSRKTMLVDPGRASAISEDSKVIAIPVVSEEKSKYLFIKTDFSAVASLSVDTTSADNVVFIGDTFCIISRDKVNSYSLDELFS